MRIAISLTLWVLLISPLMASPVDDLAQLKLGHELRLTELKSELARRTTTPVSALLEVEAMLKHYSTTLDFAQTQQKGLTPANGKIHLARLRSYQLQLNRTVSSELNLALD